MKVIVLGDIAAKIKLMPEGTDVEFEKLQGVIRSTVPEGIKVVAFEEEPIAFGLKALVAAFILPEGTSGTEELEASLAKIEGIQTVDVVEVGLL